MSKSQPALPGGVRAHDDPSRGILLMIATLMVFSICDGLTKYLAARYSPVQVTWVRYVVYVVLLMPAIVMTLRRRRLWTDRAWLQVLRGLMLVLSALCAVYALGRLAMADFTAIGFVGPLFVTALSIPFLGEHVGIRRWSAVIVGFVGVLIVVRPGTSGFEPAALVLIGGSLAWAMSFIITRKAGKSTPAIVALIWAALVGLPVTSLGVPFFWIDPTLIDLGVMVAMGICHLAGQYLLIRAIEYASASILAPITYSQIIWSTAIGAFAFNTFPDQWTIVGAVIIVASGLYVWHRERVRHAPATSIPEPAAETGKTPR
jgi:drug/metabolite transporter (DMT)-like permease